MGAVDRDVAEMFAPLALGVKLALHPFLRAELFSGEPATAAE